MDVDKNLFLYDLAVVAIMKNNGLYIKEWLDYHLLAGVDHFFIYDNGSTDNYEDVIQPYVEKGLLTDIKISNWSMGLPAYNTAVRDFKFSCRYMAFIDQDEFIFPQNNRSIIEVADDFFSANSNVAALGVNWIMFGSNGQDKADYSRGVLDRFTSRAETVNKHVKTIANPRKINFFYNPHFAKYFEGNFSVNEQGKKFEGPFNETPTADKICINHYYTKSREEYEKKIQEGRQVSYERDMETFKKYERNNAIFDDGILKYRDERRKAIAQMGGGMDELSTFAELKQVDFDKLLAALSSNLLAGFDETDAKNFFDNPKNRFNYFKIFTKFFETAPKEFFKDKIETFLTCLSLSSFLKETFIDEELGSLLEQFSLYAIYRSFRAVFSVADLQLLIKELPRILAMPYPIVGEVRKICFEFIPMFMDMHRVYCQDSWKEFVELDYILNMLKVFDYYKHK